MSLLRRTMRAASAPFIWASVGLVRGYQRFISPLLPASCRFTPTCSEYMIEALRRKGFFVGLCMGLWRIMRCNPWCKGGHDPVE